MPDNNFQPISRPVTLASKNFQLAIWFTLQWNNSDDTRCIKKLTKPKIYLVSSCSALSRHENSLTSTLRATMRICKWSLLCSRLVASCSCISNNLTFVSLKIYFTLTVRRHINCWASTLRATVLTCKRSLSWSLGGFRASCSLIIMSFVPPKIYITLTMSRL